MKAFRRSFWIAWILAIISAPHWFQAKGIAVCIGLTKLDPQHYAQNPGTLSGCDNDARDMLDIAAKAFGEPGKLLLNEQATRETVLTEITRAHLANRKNFPCTNIFDV
jgi:hypothetical protein